MVDCTRKMANIPKNILQNIRNIHNDCIKMCSFIDKVAIKSQNTNVSAIFEKGCNLLYTCT